MIQIREPITISRILEDDSWKSFPLEFTLSGLEQFKRLTGSDARKPIAYVHVEASTRRVLRIGIAGKGIDDRWTRKQNGHVSTFEWSMAYSKRYKWAKQFPHYVLFFRRLANMKTTVWTVMCCGVQSARQVERLLTSEFQPIWEQFSLKCKAAGVRPGHPGVMTVDDRTYTDPGLPVVDGLQSGRIWPFRYE